MNIYIDEDTHKTLQSRAIVQIQFGSSMYKISDEKSDKDVLCIYTPSRWEVCSVIQSHHQLQYKDKKNNIDYVYTSLPQYLRNLINGDSTINFETLFHPAMAKGAINKIWRHRHDFITYNLIKSYLGMAKRDLKQIKVIKNDREKWNKLVHVVRGVEIAAILFDTKDFSLNMFEINHPFRENLKTIKGMNDSQFYCTMSTDLIDRYEIKMEDIRDALSVSHHTGDIATTPGPHVLKHLDKTVTQIVTQEWSNQSDLRLNYKKNDYLDYFYKATHSGITY